MSDRFTLDAIRSLISHQSVSGRYLMVTYRCPTSGTQVQSKWQGPQSSGIAASVGSAAQTTLWYEVRKQANLFVRSLLGTGAMGRVAQQAVNTALASAPTSSSTGRHTLTAAEVEQGLVEAFQGVSSQFAWAGGKWVHGSAAAESLGPLDRLLHDNPLTDRYDTLLVARMLVQVAAADGQLVEAETDYLADVLDPELGSLESLRSRPPLTTAELAEASPGGTRSSMLAIVHVLALADEELHAAERALLDSFAAGLGLSASVAGEARTAAQTWLLEQALERMVTWGGHDPHARAQLVELGTKVGLSQEEVERIEARWQRRRA
ncbi:MAG: DnaJ-domain-containing protein 1 [Myxococcota bacterium]|jgi:DnaJ-domain-containing protein 1